MNHYNLIFSLLSNNHFIAYYSQMDLWKQHSMIIDGRHFIDYELIDYLRDHTEGNKCRQAEVLVKHVINGTSLNFQDLIVTWTKKGMKRHSVFIAVSYF